MQAGQVEHVSRNADTQVVKHHLLSRQERSDGRSSEDEAVDGPACACLADRGLPICKECLLDRLLCGGHSQRLHISLCLNRTQTSYALSLLSWYSSYTDVGLSSPEMRPSISGSLMLLKTCLMSSPLS